LFRELYDLQKDARKNRLQLLLNWFKKTLNKYTMLTATKQ